MSGFAMVFNKEQFLKYIERNIADDELVIITSMLNQLRYTKKKGNCLEFSYPTDGFVNNDSLNDVLNSKNVAIMICDKKILTEETIKLAE